MKRYKTWFYNKGWGVKRNFYIPALFYKKIAIKCSLLENNVDQTNIMDVI